MSADDLIDRLTGYMRARWKPLRDVENPGYAEEFLVLLVPWREWSELKEQIRSLEKGEVNES